MTTSRPDAQHLKELALHYNTPQFIESDPVQFPHRFSKKRDIEISAFVTSWISWGNRKQIIRTANHMHSDIFSGAPLDYLLSCKWRSYKADDTCFYRTVRNKDFHNLMERLYNVYQNYQDLEDRVVHQMENSHSDPATALSAIFGGIAGIADATKKSPCKRLWFFLRWMVRRDGIVDLGIWKRLSPSELIIPLDTHVHHVALNMGITTRHSADIATAKEITAYFRDIFPDDPALGDFALFGYGIEHNI